jgi:hypothetical protein
MFLFMVVVLGGAYDENSNSPVFKYMLLLALPAGMWAIWAAWKKSPSFMNDSKMQTYIGFFGETGARIFIILLGLALMVLGTFPLWYFK